MGKIKLKREPKLDSKHKGFIYQGEAVKVVCEMEYAAIFHEQGLGKSKIAIDLILYWLEQKSIDTILLIVKKGLIENWKDEFKIHTHIEPRVLSQNTNINFHILNSPCRVLLAHYEVIKKEESRLKLFLKTRNVATILDESTKIKNPDSNLTKSFFNLSLLFKKRIIMSGLPVANRPYDIWAQIYFLDQGTHLGESFSDFKQNHDFSNIFHEDESLKNNFENYLNTVWESISSFCVRETKESAGIELPNKTIKTIYTAWENKQYDLYRQVQKDFSAIIIKEGIPKEDVSDDLLKRLLRLVQIASNPALIDDSYKINPGKLEYLEELVDDIIRVKEKCIIWSSFTDNVDFLYDKFHAYGACKVHGKLSYDQRNRSIYNFKNNKDNKVLIATPGSAKEGLTLTMANHTIFYDRTFSLDDYLQSQDRIHRISQTKPCFVYNLIMQDSIDEWVDILLTAKHLAAQLAQGDITLEYYKSQISYEFGVIIREVLNIDDKTLNT
jgi:SNF2 family DNA or RNA helicase